MDREKEKSEEEEGEGGISFFGPRRFPHAREEFTKRKRRRYTGQQSRTKSASRPTDARLINRLSSAGLVPLSVYMGIPLFVLPKSNVFFARASEGRLSPGRTDPSASRSARPCSLCRSAVRAAQPRLARGVSGFKIRQMKYKGGLFVLRAEKVNDR